MFAVTSLIIICVVLNAHGLPTLQIVGGTDAPNGLYPYQASLRRSDNNKHFCGGAIISKKHIITAAHCLINLDNPSDIYVAVGSNRLDAPGAIYRVITLMTHANYNELLSIHDIGLIYVFGSIVFNEHVQPIALPNFNYNYDNYPFIATGWGRLQAGGQNPNHLQQIIVRGYPLQKCNSRYEVIQKTHICTLTIQGEGMCSGDSGGPLVADGVLIGIVSFGSFPCGSGFPDVFTRVFYYRLWINLHTGI